ncbi:MAG: IclR family transcriptional regulator [Nocardioidaceae bacterium]
MSGTGTQAIDRAAELLCTIVLADNAPLFADLVAESGLAKSTTSRLLQALERHRLVHRNDDGNYIAGPIFALYAARHDPVEELVQIAQPILDEIGAATGETVNLGVVRGNTVVQVAQVDATFILGSTNWVDVDVPPHCSALGKLFYAAGMIDMPTDALERRTGNTITSLSALRTHLARVRKQGYALTLGELEIGLDGIATPVHNRSGHVVAAIGVSGPSDRIHGQLAALEKSLKAHARTLSRELGHQARRKGAA